MFWFWSFFLYSFLGFLLEVAYARLTGGRPDRKCLLLLPLCPVYGLGACAILMLPDRAAAHPSLLFLLGGTAATGLEYLTAVFYEKALGVSFWDYRGLPGSLHGRVCLPFALIWGLLTLPLVYWLHPLLSPVLTAVPSAASGPALIVLTSDAAVSCLLLRRTGDRTLLRWYRP